MDTLYQHVMMITHQCKRKCQLLQTYIAELQSRHVTDDKAISFRATVGAYRCATDFLLSVAHPDFMLLFIQATFSRAQSCIARPIYMARVVSAGGSCAAEAPAIVGLVGT